jgi:hypothetical protein
MSERNDRIDRQERNAKKIRLSADSNSQTTAALNTTAGTSSQSHRERGANNINTNTNTNSNTNLNNSSNNNNNNNTNNSSNNLNNNERQNGERDNNKDIKMNPKMSKALSTSAKRFLSFYSIIFLNFFYNLFIKSFNYKNSFKLRKFFLSKNYLIFHKHYFPHKQCFDRLFMTQYFSSILNSNIT